MKLFHKIAITTLGLAMATATGVGIARYNRSDVKRAEAAVTITPTKVTSISAGTYVVSITDNSKDYYWKFPGTNTGLLKSSHIALEQYGAEKAVTSITEIPEDNVVTLTEVASGKFSISALDHNKNRSYIGYNSGTNLSSTTTAPTASNTSYLWTFSNGSSSGDFVITNVGSTTRILKIYSSTPDIRPYTTQEYTADFNFYPAEITSTDPAFDINKTSLTFNAGGPSQTVTASNFVHFSGTPTLSVSYQYPSTHLVDSVVNGNTITVTPVGMSDIGDYTTNKLIITATYNTEIATKQVSLKINKQSIELDRSSLNIVSAGDPVTATATPQNFEATPTYSWTIVSDTSGIITSLNNASTATVSVVPSTANVTASATIRVTATYQSNLSQTASADVTINMVAIKTSYYSYFTNDLTSDSSVAITSDTWTSTYGKGDAPSLSVSSTAKVYPGAYSSIKFGSSSAKGSLSLTVPGGALIKRVIVRAKAYVSGGETPTVDVNAELCVNGGTYQATTEEYKYYIFDLTTPSNTVTIESKDNNGRVYVSELVMISNSALNEVGAYGYAAQFLNDTDAGCAALNVTSSTWSSLSSAWTTMETNYAGSQTYFASIDADENGNPIAKAAKRYEFIVAKYKYTNFMNRTLSSAQIVVNSIPYNMTLIIVVTSTIALISVAGFIFFLKKRKHQ